MQKIKGLRWWIVGLVALATIINYIDRQALGILWPEIAKDLGLNKADSKQVYATISTFFLGAYALSKGLSGRLFDIIGTRLGFVFSIVVWSISAALHAVASSAMSFTIFRVLLGIGEAGNWPGATKANAEWFPIKERALAQGIFNSGASVGAIISAPLIAVMFGWVGWKFTFVIIGVLGLLWLIPWLLIHKAGPDKNSLLTQEERDYILNGQKTSNAEVVEEKGLSWGQLLQYKESWGVIISRFFLDPIWWMFVIWLPIYLNDVFGFEVKEIGYFAWVPYVGAALGSLFGGWFVGVLIKQGWSVGKARKSVIIGAGLIMVLGLLLGSQAADPMFAMILIAVVLFGFQVAIGNVQTLPSDYFSGKSVGTLAGLGGSAAALGSILLSTYMIPFLTAVPESDPDAAINYLPVFILGALLAPLGIMAILGLGGKIERVDINKDPFSK